MALPNCSRTFCASVCVFAVCWASGVVLSAPVDVGEEPQLFLDDHVVERMEGLKRTVNSPARLEQPVLDSATFHTCTPYATVLYDDERECFRIWYDPGVTLYYSESKDGIHWDPPRNLSLPCAYGCSVIDDGQREHDPARRYKIIYWQRATGDRPRGIYVAFSPDGLNWTPHKQNPVLLTYPTVEEDIKRHHVGDIVDAFWDPYGKRYGAALKLPALKEDGYERAPKAGILYRRLVGMSHSTDFVDWSKPWRIFVPDDKDSGLLEFYGMGGIHHRGRLWIGLVRILRDDLPCDPGGPKDGIGYTVLATSRDTINWQRYRERFMDRNPEPGTWDHAMTWASTVLPVGDELYIYYGGYARGHKIAKQTERQLGLARIKRDRYMALSAGNEPGVLVTRPIRFGGNALTVNASVREGGSLRVGLLDAEGRPLPGYVASDSLAVTGDHLSAEVQWRRKTDVAPLAGKPVRLRFELRGASLYAFQFTSTKQMDMRAGVLLEQESRR